MADLTRRRPGARQERIPEPGTTSGNVTADVVERFVPSFERGNFVDVIENSAWPE